LNPCIFLDRDGVLNEERGEYTFRPGDFRIPKGVPEALKLLKERGYKIIVITNQSGISKGVYTSDQMEECHTLLHDKTNQVIDDFYYSPYHPEITESLSRKPGTLLFERAIAKHSTDISRSWMIGDGDRDMIPARKLGIKTLFIGYPSKYPFATRYAGDVYEAARIIIEQTSPGKR
jgi:D-glycero-D-manno-heptose 1,7-bisphosphate phosphatase